MHKSACLLFVLLLFSNNAISNDNRDRFKVNCNIDFHQKYGVEHGLLQAMAYAYMGDTNLEKSMAKTDSAVGFGFHRLNWEIIESDVGVSVAELETSLCANYEVMAWWLTNVAGYVGDNRAEALRKYYYGDIKRNQYHAVEAVEKLL